jgi:hypothetical protein
MPDRCSVVPLPPILDSLIMAIVGRTPIPEYGREDERKKVEQTALYRGSYLPLSHNNI